MLIEFSVANYRSFREMQTLHLQTASKLSASSPLNETNTVSVTEKLHLVKSKVVFGANASGKSNLMRAMSAFLSIFRLSLRDQNILNKVIVPFLLDAQAFREPTFFQIRFRLDGRSYRYGFEATEFAVLSEWLFSSDGNGPESYLFKRDKEGIEVNKKTFKEAARLVTGKGEIPPLYRENTLFLPLVAAFNGPLATSIVRYLDNNYATYDGSNDNTASAIAMKVVMDKAQLAQIAEVLKRADVGIEGLELMEIPEEGFPPQAKATYNKKVAEGERPVTVVSVRRVKDETTGQNVVVRFLMPDESYGTQKLFLMSPFLLHTLATGTVLVIDEFGSSLHVKLIHMIIELFHSKKTNPHNAQLIVATHDTHLLDQNIFRRDQIAFVEKDKSGQSILTDLVEFKGVRNDTSLESQYLNGRYGAVPFTNQFGWAFTPENHGEAPQEVGSR